MSLARPLSLSSVEEASEDVIVGGNSSDPDSAAREGLDPLPEASFANVAREVGVADAPNGTLQFHPWLRPLQKINLYETRTRFFLVGSNHTQTRFRVLQLDRTEPHELVVHEDSHVYDRPGWKKLLQMIDVGNRSKVGQRIGPGVTKVCSAFGVIGFVRFLEGYYIVLITKRTRSAQLGQHTIYSIQDTELISIPNEEVRIPHPDEARYVNMFQGVDMSSNFYFSYSYDLTHSVQHNLKEPKTMTVVGESRSIHSIFSLSGLECPRDVAYVSEAESRFVWNAHLLRPLEKLSVSPYWILPIIHGFVDQSNVSIFGRSVLLTLIARRSNRYAGTRFLKRGANFQGDVANEVETEQIVLESMQSHLEKNRITSHVQIRGSVPGHWTQDTSGKIVAKPPIYFSLSDPHCRTSGRHFNELMERYGSPVVILNLVKKHEKKRKHESLLSDEFLRQVTFLNSFLPAQHQMHYIHLDMASCKKRHGKQVMHTLEKIALVGVTKTSIYVSQPKDHWTSRYPSGKNVALAEAYRKKLEETISAGSSSIDQTGVVRTNCVDCLDRTNTAQFVVGKVALGLQLFALGFLESPHVDYETDATRMLEAMYEDHGDTLALQYGGSQLIHRVKSYRKQAKWTSKANDITQTLKRYYSNTISDAEKQNSINLFLGVFIPSPDRPPLWDVREYPTDIQWHLRADNSSARNHWWNPALCHILPKSTHDNQKTCTKLYTYSAQDLFEDHYRSFEYSVMADLFAIKQVSHSIRDYMPNCVTDYSPFVVRSREGKRVEDTFSTSSSSTNASSRLSAITTFLSSLTSSSSSVQKGTSTSYRASSPTVSTHSLGSESDDESSPSDNSDGWEDLSTSSPTAVARGDDVIEMGQEVQVAKSLEDLFPESKRAYKWNLSKTLDSTDRKLLRNYAEYCTLASHGHRALSWKSHIAVIRKQFEYKDVSKELRSFCSANGVYKPNPSRVKAMQELAQQRRKGKPVYGEIIRLVKTLC